MPLHRDWESALRAALGSGRLLSVSPAESVKVAGQPPDQHRLTTHTPDLLLMRMEALGLNAAQVKASTPNEFRVLAHVCDYCQDKVRCERDILYEAAGKAVRWEHYCPNASSLISLHALAEPMDEGLIGE